MKILKNTTTSLINLKETGISLPAESSTTLNVEEYIIFASASSLTEIQPFLSDGGIIVNDGNRDLNADKGIDYLRYPDQAGSITVDATAIGATSHNLQEVLEEIIRDGGKFSFRNINSSKTVIIKSGQQMTVHGQIEIDGCLIIEGDLILEK